MTTSLPRAPSTTGATRAPLAETHDELAGGALRPLDPSGLDEATEKARVAENGGRGLLLPYLRFDPEAAPYVLVHGLMDSAASLRPLADRIDAAGGRQVYLFLYDDAGRYLDRTGDDLARELVRVSSASASAGPPAVRIVAHSMGGIVARCAMCSLVDPEWFPEMSADPDAPAPLRGTSLAEVAGIRLDRSHVDAFSRVDLLAIDTPWQGFTDLRVEVRNKMEREASYVDMVAGSALFAALYATKLPPTFTLNYVEADNVAAGESPDKIVAFGELGDEAVDSIKHFFAGEEGALDQQIRLRNQIRSLEAEADFPALEAALHAEATSGRLSPDRFRALIAQAIPKLPGSHTSILRHPGLFDEIERTFSRHSPGAGPLPRGGA